MVVRQRGANDFVVYELSTSFSWTTLGVTHANAHEYAEGALHHRLPPNSTAKLNHHPTFQCLLMRRKRWAVFKMVKLSPTSTSSEQNDAPVDGKKLLYLTAMYNWYKTLNQKKQYSYLIEILIMNSLFSILGIIHYLSRSY